jgi:hypothetical protein
MHRTLTGETTRPAALTLRLQQKKFISEVFQFEVPGFEQVEEDFYKVSLRDVEIGEPDAEGLRFRPVQIMR